MKGRRIAAAGAVSLIALGIFAAATPAKEGGPVLVELFTSEGCSSCPPADALLGRIARESVAGVRVVALSEHVDYWDDLGWRDRFSSPLFTQRQEAYVRRLRLTGPYTPQLVVAGRTNALGGDGRAARAAIAAAAREPSGRIDLRFVRQTGGDQALDIQAMWSHGVAAEIVLAVVQERATTRVTGGENAGRTLEHVSVVRSLSVLGSGVGAFSGRTTLQRGAAEATHVVVFVQERDGGPVHAVASVRLP